MRQLYVGTATLSLIACLSACGGSAHVGHAPPPPPAPTEVPPPLTTPSTGSFDTDEYQNSTSANQSGAIAAWQHGATGKGVKIGFVDTGLYLNNPEFAGRIDPGSGDAAGDRP